MRVTILGSGGAGGVPTISGGWGFCNQADPRNRRSRPSILVERRERNGAATRILVDTSPDLREQLLRAGVRHLDAILYTHFHADHTHGVDDVREVNRAMGRAIPCWADGVTLEALHQRFGYIFHGIPENEPIFRPWLIPHRIDGPFEVGGIRVVPFEQDHGWVTSLGFRFGDVAYSTDVVRLPEQAFAALDGVRTWIVGCLTDTPHETHAHVDRVIEWAERVRPERTILTHMGPRLDYATLKARLPASMEPAYDGLVIDTP